MVEQALGVEGRGADEKTPHPLRADRIPDLTECVTVGTLSGMKTPRGLLEPVRRQVNAAFRRFQMPNIGRFGLALMVALGCAPPQGGGDTNNARTDRNVITLPEVEAARTNNVIDNAYELVRTLQPMWLRKRGSHSIQYEGDIVVYLDNVRLGGPEALRQVETINITSIRYYDPGAANFKFGSGHDHGAIQVSTALAVERPTS